MKQILFIDNDNIERATQELSNATNNIILTGKVPEEKINNIKIIPYFSNMDFAKALDLLFNNNNCLITWSMFTDGGSCSASQLTSFLKAAGRNNITGMTFIDTASYLYSRINFLIDRDEKQIISILKAIEMNYIIHCDYKECYRIRIDFSNGVNLRKEEIDLNQHLLDNGYIL